MPVTWVVPTLTMTRIPQHFDEESSVFNHLNNNRSCKEKCNKQNCFKNLDNGNSTYQLAIKEGLHTRRGNPVLNKQQKHEVITTLV